ncbi:MAG: sulfur oxidation c-type cytochrome SoxX [Pseudomonadota bacterium]|jgi:sulfur-oxidizing protein SoxX
MVASVGLRQRSVCRVRTSLARLAWVAVAGLSGMTLARAAEPEPVWQGDAIALPLTATPGDAQRGRAIVESRQSGLCLLCHPLTRALAGAQAALQGNLAPPLAGSGQRLTTGQLRARLVDSRRLRPASVMPAYFVTLPAGEAAAPQRIATAWQGRRLLDAQQIEDVIEFLQTLKEED